MHAEGVEVGDVVTSNLERANEELDLRSRTCEGQLGSPGPPRREEQGVSPMWRPDTYLHVVLDDSTGDSGGKVERGSSVVHACGERDETRRRSERVLGANPLVHAREVDAP